MKVKRLYFVIGTVLAFTGVLNAQENNTPQVEVDLSYSGLHLTAPGNNGQRTGNGGSGSVEYNLNSFLGVVADVGGYANTKTGIEDKLMTYLFGPRLNWRFRRLNPYVQTLFGGGYAWSGPSDHNQNAFNFALGGGLDYQLTNHIAIKPIQVEYLRSEFNSEKLGDSTSSFGDHQNGVRYSAGIVFRLGQK